MVKLRFAKLYTKIKDDEMYIPSIIAFQSTPKTFDTKCYNGGQCKVIITSWGRRLYINLWFIELKFNWIKTL